MQTTDINLEFWLFLKNLIEIKKNAAVFDSQTVNLLKTIQNNVTDLLNQVKNKHVNIHNPPNNEYELLRDANKDEFQFQRFLVCQICNVSFFKFQSNSREIYGKMIISFNKDTSWTMRN